MNRAEFMRRLAKLLGDVSPMEREEAIQYYNDYFDDAGVENESGVIASLGTPEELARSIKAGLYDGGNGGEFTESGFSGYAQSRRDEVIRTGEAGRTGQSERTDSRAEGFGAGGGAGQAGGTDRGAQGGNAYYQGGYYQRNGGDGVYGGREDARRHNNPYGQTYGQSEADRSSSGPSGSQQTSQKKGMSGGTIVLIVILAVLTSPIWIGILGTLFGVAAGLILTVFGLSLGFLITGVVLVVVAFALLVAGIAAVFTAPVGGVCLVGCAMIAFALGLVFIWLMVLLAGMAIPALVQGILSLCRRLFHRGGAWA